MFLIPSLSSGQMILKVLVRYDLRAIVNPRARPQGQNKVHFVNTLERLSATQTLLLGREASEHLQDTVPQHRILPQTGTLHMLLFKEADLS